MGRGGHAASASRQLFRGRTQRVERVHEALPEHLGRRAIVPYLRMRMSAGPDPDQGHMPTITGFTVLA